MSATSLAEGTLFAGRYRVLRCIAAGGMGAVYEVVHVETERRRALKVMHPQFLQSKELRDRFRQEARVAAHIESEFIVDVFDAGIDDATQMPFLVMEMLRGEELGKLLLRRGRLSPAEVVTYLHQAALALDKTHSAQIVHRDLKPENLFLTQREDGLPRVKILDFGIAKVVADSGTNVNTTRSIGTPLYMAPEQFRPGHKVSPAADLYALSMMAYTLLVGRTYWAEEAEGGNVFAFAAVAMRGPEEPATARAHRAGVPLPPGFDAWFARAAAFQPEARYPSATATVTALAEALGVPVPGLGASGPQGAASAQTQVLGDGAGPGLHGPAPAPHAGGQRGVMHTSASGNLGGTVGIAPRRSSSPVLAGVAAGLAVCLAGGGGAAYFLWPRPTAAPAEQAVDVPVSELPAAVTVPPPTVEPAPAQTQAPTPQPAPTPVEPTSAPAAAKPTAAPPKPTAKPAPTPAKKPGLIRD